MSIFYCLSKRKRWLLLLSVLLSLQSKAFTQDSSRITVQGNNIPIETALRQIEKQSGFSFVYGKPTLDDTERITVDISGKGFTAVMDALLGARGIVWSFRGGAVVLSRRGEDVKMVADTVPRITVTGTVVDGQGKAVPGSTVMVKGTKLGTQSDGEGRFILADIPVDAVLVIRSIGYEGKQVKVGGKSIVPIVLSEAVTELKNVEVVSTGYQDIPKERATGSFVQLDNKIINRSVSTNILDRLKGITSGLNFEPRQAGGREFTIRGNSTINANPRPLIVVDGFPYDESANLQNEINSINPNDVESITVLKDAAAASIWGARSGNGVIVIKTKKGKFNQRTKVQLNSNVTIGEKPNLFYQSTISSKDLVDFEKKRFATGYFNEYDDSYPGNNYFPVVSPVIEILLAERRGTITSTEAKSKLSMLEKHDVRNDVNRYLLQKSVNQQYNLNISGGATNYNYYGSLGYDRNRMNSVGNNYDRFTLRFESTYRPFAELSVDAFAVVTESKTKNNSEPYASLSPYYMLMDANGLPAALPKGYRMAYLDTATYPGLLDWHYRPLEELNYNDDLGEKSDIRIGAGVNYTIIDGLSLNAKFQYQKTSDDTRNIMSLESYESRNLINQFLFESSGALTYPVPFGGIIDRSNGNVKGWNVRGALNLDRNFVDFRVSAIAGMETREVKSSGYRIRQYGYDPSTGSVANSMDFSSFYPVRPNGEFRRIDNPMALTGTLYRYLSYFSNGAISYKDKYTVSGSARFDGSNFFGIKANQRIVPLWSSGISWDISRENFYTIDWLPNLKIRATYGFNGNTNNNATAFATIRYNVPGSFSIIPEQFAVLGAAPNPQLRWERVALTNIGIDFQIKNQRLGGSIEYYAKNGTDLIGPFNIDPTTGFSIFTGNRANMKSKGIDVTINSVNIKGEVNWNTTFLLSYNKEKVTSYQALKELLASSYISGGVIVGKPLLPVYGYKWGGLDPANGEPRGIVADTIAPYSTVLAGSNTNPQDLVYFGSQTPLIFGSLLNTFTIKRITLSFNIVYKFQYYFRRNSIQYAPLYQDFNLIAHGDYDLRWRKSGDEMVTSVPSLPSAADFTRDMFYSQSEILIEKGDHVRLQDLRIGYDLDKTSTRFLPFQHIQLYGYVNNLGIIWRKNKKGLDPDYNGAIPPSKSFSLGLSIDF